jgi:radical SAM superfamily enzyme YgiQ (UPF0313 family)
MRYPLLKFFFISLLEEVNPLGLLHMSTFLQAKGHAVTTVFAPLNPKEAEFGVEENRLIEDGEIHEIIRLAAQENPDIIGISLMTIHFHTAVLITKNLKEKFPEKQVIWGGIHPSLQPDECIEHADIICKGEGELAMLELADHMQKGESFDHIESLWVKTAGTIVRNEVRPLVQDLDSLGFPRFDWQNNYVLYQDKVLPLTKELYQLCVPRNGHIYDVMATRGCPYHCTYCCNASFKKMYAGKGKLLRSRGVAGLMEELEYVKTNFSFVNFINFQDDVFLVRPDDGWLEDFCSEYKKRINLPFICKGSPREVRDKSISLLRDAGMEYFHIGIQNSDRVNREIYKRKTSSRQDVIRASEILHKYKVVGRYDVILDDPFANDEDTLEVLDTLTKVKKPFLISCFSMTFFPNSEIYKMAEKANMLSKGKNGYLLKTTFAKRNYLNNLVEISPRVPAALVNFFIRHRKKKYAERLLNAYIFFHYNIIFRAMYTISKYPKILTVAKNIRFRLSAAAH